MENVFLAVLNMSLTASYIIPFVVLARLLLKKVPKIYSYCLWSVVLFRLLCPFSLESALSLLPKEVEAISRSTLIAQNPEISTGIPTIDQSINPEFNEILPTAPPPETGNSVNPLQIWTFVAQMLWVSGIIVMLLVASVSLLQLKKKLMITKELDKGVFFADDITSPFVFGVISPKIYLPSSINEEEIPLILAHERFHLKRFDHVTRLLSFIALTLHWFNPLVWFAYYLSEKDMETSCDEGVLREKSLGERGDYATALLKFTGRKSSLTPLAFSENDTKGRVKNIMKMKKATLFASGLAGVLVTGLIVGFSSNQPHALNFAYQKEQNTLSLETESPCNFYEDPLYMRKDGITIEIPQEFTDYWAQVGTFHNSGVATNQVFHKIQFLPSSDSMTDLEHYQKEMEPGFHLLALTELKLPSQISVFPTEKQFIPFVTSSGETFSYYSHAYLSWVAANAPPSIDPTGAGLRGDDSKNEYWAYDAMFNHEKGTLWVHASVDTREELVGLEQLVLSLVDRATVSSEGMSDPQGLDPEDLAVYFRIDNEGNEVEIPFEELFIDEKPW